MERYTPLLPKQFFVLTAALLLASILILSYLAYADQLMICRTDLADPFLEPWLQGIARTVK